MRNKEKKSAWETWSPWLGFVILVFVVGKCSDTSGPQYPGDHINEDAEYQADQSEADNRDYDPASQYDALPTDAPDTYESFSPNDSSCPNGCTSHVAGCDIKGNISIDSGTKIYHLPGMEYYEATTIDPAYGERWFCTTSEAEYNGWRRSSQ